MFNSCDIEQLKEMEMEWSMLEKAEREHYNYSKEKLRKRYEIIRKEFFALEDRIQSNSNRQQKYIRKSITGTNKVAHE